MLFVLGLLANFIPSFILYFYLKNRVLDDDEYRNMCREALLKGFLCVPFVILASATLSLLGGILKTGSLDILYSGLYQKFIVITLAEEMVKYLMLKHLMKKNEYRYSWIAIISFMIIIGTGFGILEDIVYAIGSSPIHMIVRGITAMHSGFGFVMGYFEGKSYHTGKKWYSFIGFILAYLMHGIYDYTLIPELGERYEMIAFIPVTLAFICFVLLIYMFIFFAKAKKKEKYTDIVNV